MLGDGPGELEGDARAADVRVRILRAGDARVDHRERLGELGLHRVVVGDDQVEPDLAAEARLLDRRDAVVDRDDDLDPLLLGAAEAVDLETVAILHAIGDMHRDLGPERAEDVEKHGRAGVSVDVVIGVEEDRILLIDGARETFDRPFHVGEQHGVMEVGERRLEEGARRDGVAHPPLPEEARQDPRDPRLPRDGALEALLGRVA